MKSFESEHCLWLLLSPSCRCQGETRNNVAKLATALHYIYERVCKACRKLLVHKWQLHMQVATSERCCLLSPLPASLWRPILRALNYRVRSPSARRFRSRSVSNLLLQSSAALGIRYHGRRLARRARTQGASESCALDSSSSGGSWPLQSLIVCSVSVTGHRRRHDGSPPGRSAFDKVLSTLGHAGDERRKPWTNWKSCCQQRIFQAIKQNTFCCAARRRPGQPRTHLQLRCQLR